ncbi:DUF2157 domain-containing protein [Paenibacillus sp. SYP-B3998]|uniref:DUF2157 domain-containing protein n=1 Tax=Paenibacillus sp. SYP-B3998 TaxID=2678564 RepID=A0A6G3ZW87_9BACL|nr:GDYXXLXY domain-containing protein [Paenibacillus sp. SYP-B3998]NEW06308.1 DUF2157 domain-containing protein [Paenibacillus sp. SYP-B3998]
MKSKWVTIGLGYVLGVSLLLTAIGYFYATNWQALNRTEKFVPVFLLILGFYGLSVWLSRKSGRAFLSRLSLFASCVSFGVGIALIGQTYNSHADSYSLFAIWMIPALLLALLTRWQPFYVLAYLLGHMAYMLYYFPEWGGNPNEEGIVIVIWLVVALVNGCLYVFAERKRLQTPFIKWISFQVSMAIMLWLSNSIVFEQYGVVMNLPLVVVLLSAISYTYRTRNKMFLLSSGLWVSAMITLKFIELTVKFYHELFFLFGLLFVIILIAANVKFVQYIRTWNLIVNSEGESIPEVKHDGDFTKWVIRVVTVSVVVIGTLLGSLCIIGLVILVLDIENPSYLLYGYGLITIITMIALKNLNSLVRYTLMCSGFLLGVGAAVAMDNILMQIVFLALSMITFVFISGTVQRIFFFFVGETIMALLLNHLYDEPEMVFVSLVLLLLIVFIVGMRIRHVDVKKPLLLASFPSFLFAFFMLTFITEAVGYYVSNVLFFITIVLVLIISKQRQVTWIYRWGLGFWVAFLVCKYYDLAWKLLHKSLSFAIIGALILALTFWYERRKGQPEMEDSEEASRRVKSNRLLIMVLVLLQIIAMSLQIGKSEWLLAHGQLIKLQLEPLDPRSMMQGDYVRLRYAISEPEPRKKWSDRSFSNKKITVVLAPKASTDVFEFRRMYTKGEALGPGEIRLNGSLRGMNSVEYGIETYFIPEGTGHDYERNAKYAEVKVSASGDAILVRLLLETSLNR